MPAVNNDAPAVNYVDYFTKQFPKDLAQMAQLRDELEKRQGALSAAEAALADREKAAAELAAAKEQAAALLKDASETNAASKAKKSELDAREKEFDKSYAAGSSALADREKAVAAAEARLAEREQRVVEAEKRAIEKADSLSVQDQLLQARVKAFQDKVAALSA